MLPRLVSAKELLAQGLSKPEVQKSVLEQAAPRFWAKVNKTATCWLWTGAHHKHGYGQIRMGSKREKTQHTMMAPRYSYALFVGPIPEGQELDHLCRTPACVNPAHLQPVSHRDNMLRGINPTAQNASKTHCSNGHLFDLVNTRWDGHRTGCLSRVCRTCKRIRTRQAYKPRGKR